MNSLRSVVLNEGLEEIGVAAFYGCSFAHIRVPHSVTHICDDAFGECKKLKRIMFEDNINIQVIE